MLAVLGQTWALLLGMGLLMIGNGLSGTLLGVRGAIEGFSTFEMSFVMSAYFVGFLGGSRLTPEMIRRVGHIRVFAALASFVSAVLILYPVIANPIAWMLLRVMFGFCFSGIYVTAESWLNNASANETRGQALSAYLIVQMMGIVAAQGILTLGDPSGYTMFIVPSVLVSLAFAPVLLSAVPVPAFETAKPMNLAQIFRVSPLGCVGMAMLGLKFSALFGMAAVYGSLAGLSVAQISILVASIYLGGMLMQWPIGWLSDRMDRRRLIAAVSLGGAVAATVAVAAGSYLPIILAASFVIGGVANPLYALLLAYTNDYLEGDEMAAASGSLVFINGMGAIVGPLIVGWAMDGVGPPGFFIFLGAVFGSLCLYALYRMTRRPAPSAEGTGVYAPIFAETTVVAAEVAGEWATEYQENLEMEEADEAR